MAEKEPTRAEVIALLVRWELAEFGAQEVHESAELLREDAPDMGAWPGIGPDDPRWGPRTVIGLLSNLAAAPYFPEDVPALRALLDTNASGAVRHTGWLDYQHSIDWEARGRHAARLSYYDLWHRI